MRGGYDCLGDSRNLNMYTRRVKFQLFWLGAVAINSSINPDF